MNLPFDGAQLLEAVREFDDVVSNGSESDIHRYLIDHMWIIFLVLSGKNRSAAQFKSKFPLGEQYETDFVTIEVDPAWYVKTHVTFIEIERANERLFTKAGDPSAYFTHALRQVQDWKFWIGENRDYVAKRLMGLKSSYDPKHFHFDRRFHFEYGFCDHYLLIAGRHRDLGSSELVRLTQMNEDLMGIKIVTYDRIIECLLGLNGHTKDWKTGRDWGEHLYRIPD